MVDMREALLRCYQGFLCGHRQLHAMLLGKKNIFVVPPLLGRVTTILNFLHLFAVCLTVDWWALNSLQMLITC